MARSPRAGASGVIAAVWLAIVLAGIGGAALTWQTSQAQWQQQQQSQQRFILQAWAQQLTLRLEGYQRVLLGMVHLVQTRGLERVQHEKIFAAGFESVFFVPLDGPAQTLVPMQPHPSGAAPSFSPVEHRLLQRAQAQGGLAVAAQARQAEWVQLTWVQPLRNSQGQLSGMLLARTQLPPSLLLPNFLDSTEGAADWVFTVQDKGSGWSLQSPRQDGVQKTAPALAVETLALAAPAWVLQSQLTAAAPALVWPWQGLVLLGLVLCMAVAYGVRRQWRIGGQGASAGPRGVRAHAPPKRNSALRWNGFLQANPGAMWVVQGPLIQAANAHACTLLGYAPEFLTGAWLHYLLLEHSQQHTIQQAVLTHGHYRGWVPLRKADGAAVWVEVSAYRLDTTDDACDATAATVWQLWTPWSQLPICTNPAQAGVVAQEDLLHWLQAHHQHYQRQEEGAHPQPATGSLLFIDIDCLGALNEAVDRAFGDQVLAWIGQLLRQTVLPIGRAVHLGGDEFAAILPTVGQAHALMIGEQLCQQAHDWQPQWQGEKHWISISIGVVAWDARLHDGPSILRAADMACYQAKRKGKAQVVVGML